MTACFIDSYLEHRNFLTLIFHKVTHLKCGGIVNDDFVANLLINLSGKEF